MADAVRKSPGLGIYVHVPYCASLCSYCDFHREAAPGGIPAEFDSRLLEEVVRYREEPPIGADTLYFGGGTPSLLGTARLSAIMEALRGTFVLDPKGEVTLEANPETVEREGLAGWLRAGVNRLSLGAQSLDRDELALLGRRAEASAVRRSVTLAHRAGFERLSVDLMIGVPGQSAASLGRTLDEVVAWPVDHVSAYLLDLHRGTPLFAEVLRGELALPGDEASADLYDLLCDRLEAAGFRQYEVSNFARPGGESRHNLNYWRFGEWIGLGPSAHGHFRGQRTENPRSTARWAEALRRGEAPHERVLPVSEAERLENRVIFGLRLAEGIEEEELVSFLRGQGRDPQGVLGPLVAHAYARRTEDGRFRLTRQGFLVSNEVLTFLLPDSGKR